MSGSWAGDEYFYEPGPQILQGKRTGEAWQAGDRMEVVIREVNHRERRISLARHYGHSRGRK